MDEDLKLYLDGLEVRMKTRFDRLAETMATEVGTLHEQIKDIDGRLQRVDGNTITTMELLTRQSRWHEHSDNAVRALTVRQGEFDRKLNELRGGK